MKQNLYLIAFLLMFLSQISASFVAAKNVAGHEETKLKELASEGSLQQMEDRELMDQLMGMDVCENGDEDCLKRRIISEAHLDYIYTQHHKP